LQQKHPACSTGSSAWLSQYSSSAGCTVQCQSTQNQ
jgi:hypothetical protein